MKVHPNFHAIVSAGTRSARMLPRMWQACRLAGSPEIMRTALQNSAAIHPLHTSSARLANDPVFTVKDLNDVVQAISKRFVSSDELFFWGCLGGTVVGSVALYLGDEVDRTQRSAERKIDAKISDLKWELKRELGDYQFKQAGNLGQHQGELMVIHRHRRQVDDEIEELRQSLADVMSKLQALETENKDLKSQLPKGQTQVGPTVSDSSGSKLQSQ